VQTTNVINIYTVSLAVLSAVISAHGFIRHCLGNCATYGGRDCEWGQWMVCVNPSELLPPKKDGPYFIQNCENQVMFSIIFRILFCACGLRTDTMLIAHDNSYTCTTNAPMSTSCRYQHVNELIGLFRCFAYFSARKWDFMYWAWDS
jgi:hypothetical protein